MAGSRRWIEMGAGLGVVLIAFALIVPAVEQSREAARRQRSKMHLLQIGIALHNYHESYETLPPGGVFDEAGTEYLGWPVLILPYVDSNPYYNQINFHVPWDQQPNPEIFRWPLNGFYTIPGCEPVVDGRGFGLSHYAGNQQLLFRNSSVSLSKITDGTGQTLLAGEVFADFLPYGKPANWRDPAYGLQTISQSFGRPTQDGAYFLMSDGKVGWLSKGIDPAVFRALGTPDGRELIPQGVLAGDRVMGR